MTTELAQPPRINAWLVFGIRCAVGLLVLLPAFILWMQGAILDNVGRSTSLAGAWQTVLFPMATVAYLISLALWTVTRKRSFVRDGYLVLYCAYVAAFFAWAFSPAKDLEALAYMLPAIVFAIDRLIMILARPA